MTSKKQWLLDELEVAFAKNLITSDQALVFVDDLHPEQHFGVIGSTWTLRTDTPQFMTGREQSYKNKAAKIVEVTFPVTPTEFLNWGRLEDNPLKLTEEYVDAYLNTANADQLLFCIADHRLVECLSGRSLWRRAISEIIGQLLEQQIVPTVELVESVCRQDPSEHEILEFADETAEVVVRTEKGGSKRLDYSQSFVRQIQRILLNLRDASRELIDKKYSFTPRK